MKSKTTKTKIKTTNKPSTDQRDLPATMGLVHSVRNELKTSIFRLDKKIDGLDTKIDSKFAEAMISFHRMETLLEEQRSENRIVLEGLSGMNQRMGRIESRQDEHERTLLALARTGRAGT